MLPLTRLGHLLDFFGDDLDGLLDAALELHRVGAGHDVLGAFAVDRLRQHRRRRRAVTGRVRRLARDLAHHLRAHVLERVLQVDFLGHGHAVLGDRGRAELLVEDDVAALGAERDLHGVCQLIDAAKDRLARLLAVDDLLRHCCYFSRFAELQSRLLRNNGEDFVLAHDQVFVAVDLDFLAGILAEQDRVAVLDVERDALAVLVGLAGADGNHLALLRLFLGGVGDDDAPDFLFFFLDAFNEDAVM